MYSLKTNIDGLVYNHNQRFFAIEKIREDRTNDETSMIVAYRLISFELDIQEDTGSVYKTIEDILETNTLDDLRKATLHRYKGFEYQFRFESIKREFTNAFKRMNKNI